MGLINKIFGNRSKSPVLGWVQSPVLFHTVSGAWRPEKGFNIDIIIIRLSRSQRNDIDFNVENALLRLDDGTEITPIGLIPCLDSEFRGLPGQPIPPLLSTQALRFSQSTGECIGYVYGVHGSKKPEAVQFNGDWVEGIKKMNDDQTSVSTTTSGEMNIKAISNATLLDHIPFCDPGNSLDGMSVLRPPKYGYGILSFSQNGEYSIFSVRIPPEDAESLRTVDSEKIEAMLANGTVCKAKGVVIPSPDLGTDVPTPYCVMDRGLISADGKQMKAGANFHFLYNFLGPTTGFSFADCKIVTAFDRSVTLEEIQSIRIGDYVAALVDGTLIYEK